MWNLGQIWGFSRSKVRISGPCVRQFITRIVSTTFSLTVATQPQILLRLGNYFVLVAVASAWARPEASLDGNPARDSACPSAGSGALISFTTLSGNSNGHDHLVAIVPRVIPQAQTRLEASDILVLRRSDADVVCLGKQAEMRSFRARKSSTRQSSAKSALSRCGRSAPST